MARRPILRGAVEEGQAAWPLDEVFLTRRREVWAPCRLLAERLRRLARLMISRCTGGRVGVRRVEGEGDGVLELLTAR